MFKPKYPTADTYTPTTLAHAPAAAERTEAPAPTHNSRPGLVDLARHNPAAAVTGVVATGAVVTSMFLAVAITALALSISGVVLLALVRMLRQDTRR
ncbi:SpdD protein [Streptomyces sp. MUM 178J]|uniref:SpdD protein n=1 Tax=Streptomyces sp. MUM 178J TaxID=2791991 RepID=UPI001F039A75|nr:SpdD protein [Streptomyces sp. MUM 178J]WRQ82944.1 SpdD protein [Streptomyces sp. MUM 178J]